MTRDGKDKGIARTRSAGRGWLSVLGVVLVALGLAPRAWAQHATGQAASETIAHSGQVASPGAPTLSAEAGPSDWFERHIRPIFEDHCVECHGTRTEANGGLVLDWRGGWQRGGAHGPVIVVGNPDQSRLIQAVGYADAEMQMPPEGRLSPAAIQALREWIARGAIDPRTDPPSATARQARLAVADAQQHWAYRPVVRPAVPRRPAVSHRPASTTIDAFLEEELARRDLTPLPTAPRAVLIRRLTLDLHGLAPSQSEIREFERDERPDAYERLVDRLLASPRFAERMARHWLDLARYAESLTLRGFILPEAWRYRDYCITAFAADRPLDQFVREQLAGDLLPAQTLAEAQQQQIAVSFLLLGNTNLEEQDKRQLEMDVVDEQLDVLGRALLGQTIGCARCHDHKFDPIPTHDYYALAGILRSSRVLDHENVSKWIERPLPLPPEQLAKYVAWEQELTSVTSALSQFEAKRKGEGQVGPKLVQVSDIAGVVVDDAGAKVVGDWQHSTSVPNYVGGGYLHDQHAGQGTKTVTFEPAGLAPGSYEVRLAYAPGDNRASNALVRVFSADGETTRQIDQRRPGTLDGLWVSLGRFRFEANGQAFVLVSNEGADGHVIADAVQFLPESATKVAETLAPTGPTSAVLPTNSVMPTNSALPTSAAEHSTVVTEQHVEQLQQRQQELTRWLADRPKALALVAEPTGQDLRIHHRGSVHQLGDVVPRGFLSLVQLNDQAESAEKIAEDAQERAANPAGGPDRRALAAWMTHPDHPLTSRVLANRIWYWLFGEGLVRSVDNFGTTGESPTHPELLDWLAKELSEHGWSTKRLVRLIVLSDAYRRQSHPSEESAAVERAQLLDPENRWLWRAHRKMLDAEVIRDTMLQVSGELELEMGGRRFPAQLTADYDYEHDRLCRSIYLPHFRNSLPDLLEAFNVADPSVVVGQRNQGIVPQQALLLMNSPWVAERAERAARRLLGERSATTAPALANRSSAADSPAHDSAAQDSPAHDSPAHDSAAQDSAAQDSAAQDSAAQDSSPPILLAQHSGAAAGRAASATEGSRGGAELSDAEVTELLEQACQTVWGRRPEAAELSALQAFWRDSSSGAAEEVLADIVQMMFAAVEFRFAD